MQLFPRAYKGMPSRRQPGGVAPLVPAAFPVSVAMLNGWTERANWNLLLNFTNAGGGTVSCGSSGDSDASFTVTRHTTNPELLAGGEGGYEYQGGIRIRTAPELMFNSANVNWNVSTTMPTAILLTVRFDGTPTVTQDIAGGQDGAGNGWLITSVAGTGIRFTFGNQTSTVATGSSAIYDGEWHDIMLVLNAVPSNGSRTATLFTEYTAASVTAVTYSPVGNLICTLGPASSGASWDASVSYGVLAKGGHEFMLADGQQIVDSYTAARTTFSLPADIDRLPTTLAEVNSLTGIAFTHAWNVNSATPSPMTGSAGSAMAAETGAIFGGNSGVAPSVSAAPQVRTSMTGQAAARFAVSTWANLKADLPLAHLPYALLVIYKQAAVAAAKPILGRGDNTNQRGFLLNSPGNNRNTLYHRNSGLSVTSLSLATASSDATWRVAALSVTTSAQLMRDNALTASAATALGTVNPSADQGYLGARPTSAASGTAASNGGDLDVALVAWVQSPGLQPDATALETAVNALRKRYGI